MTPLQTRVYDCAPLFQFGLEALLRLLDVEETRAVPTAAVPLGRCPRLLLNPDFVAAACPAEEDLAVLVLHELHHLLLGHTRLFRRVTEVDNLAFDAVINAMLCRRLPEPRFHAFFRRIYSARAFPECLLRPPEGTHPVPAVAALLRELYEGDQGTYHDVYALLRRELQVVGTPLLLGSHGADGRGLEVHDDPDLFAAVRAVVERWPQPPDPRVGRSFDAALRVEQVHTVPGNGEVLRRALLAAARPGERLAGRVAPRTVLGEAPGLSRDRRSVFAAARGQPPLLSRQQIQGQPRPEGVAPVDVYVDVSGSVQAAIPALYGAILACRDVVAPTVFAFSTEVVPLDLDAVSRGEVRTTGGTVGAAFTAHLAARRSRAAVVLTDGYVGAIPGADHPACRAARLQVVLTQGGHQGDLAPVACAFHQLEVAC